jgi:hypothetical protein
MVNAITAIPRTAIKENVAGAGAVSATVKNAKAHSGIASRRWNTSAISSMARV